MEEGCSPCRLAVAGALGWGIHDAGYLECGGGEEGGLGLVSHIVPHREMWLQVGWRRALQQRDSGPRPWLSGGKHVVVENHALERAVSLPSTSLASWGPLCPVQLQGDMPAVWAGAREPALPTKALTTPKGLPFHEHQIPFGPAPRNASFLQCSVLGGFFGRAAWQVGMWDLSSPGRTRVPYSGSVEC